MINPDFSRRRQQLLAQIGEDAIAIIPAGEEIIRNGDIHFPFRQNSDFYYLTGFEEPDAVAVFLPGGEQGEYILFNRLRDKTKEIWEGAIVGQEQAVTDFNADKAYPISEIEKRLPELLNNRKKIYYDFGANVKFNNFILEIINNIKRQIRRGINAPSEFHSLQALLHEMRCIKSEYELELMRKAGEISAKAHKHLMQICKPGMMEYQLASELNYQVTQQGCMGAAYPSIVGGGANACVLHYTVNNAKLREGDLVLVDAAGEYNYYSSDITRTFPVNGKFSKEQRLIYELVLKAQKAGIAAIKPGNPWIAMHEAPVQVITEGLVELGILKGDITNLIQQKAYFEFFMHFSGHWLGLDTHDSGCYKINGKWQTFKAGMVTTMEPGIYIAPNNPQVDKKWWGIGIRIEDNIIVTANGNENMTRAAPTEVEEIEAVMRT